MSDEEHMRHALGLAARGLGHVWPNPAVGCVLVRGGRIVGRGWTQPGGRPHAERRALDQAGEAARGAVAYVTLEPCAHHGHTPPCAEGLIAAGVSGVVTALTDPDARVSGKGHAMLRAAGIAVREGVLSAQAQVLNRGFLKRVEQGMPLITLKLATSLDGRIATSTGESRWITGAEARRRVHLMRLTHDAVMVGAGTARADDPDLGVRDIGAGHQPIRVVLDSRLSLSPDSRLGQTARERPVWMLHGPDVPLTVRHGWMRTGAQLIQLPEGPRDLRVALRALGERGLTRVFCEGGGQLAASLMAAGLVDDLALFSAGVMIGGDGLAALGSLGIAALGDAPRFALVGQERVGADLFSLWRQT